MTNNDGVIQKSPPPNPMPPWWFWIFAGVVIVSYGLGAYSLIQTIQCFSRGGATIQECMTPGLLTVGAFTVIVGGMYYYIPVFHEILRWALVGLMGVGGVGVGSETQEGFLVAPGKSPRVKGSVIGRRELLDRLREHLFHRATLPYGLQCSPSPTTGSTPCSQRGPSRDAIYGYVQRILQHAPSSQGQRLPPGWEGKVKQLMDLVCEERCLLEGVITKIEVDSQIQYSMDDVKLRILPLLRFYNRARIGDSRYRSRREVDQMIGLPLGERDPINETSLVGVNRFRLKTSVHDTGDDPDKPTDGADVRAFLEHAGAFPGDGSRPLATQTNELRELDSMAHHSLARGSIEDRAGNAPDIGFYHRSTSSYM